MMASFEAQGQVNTRLAAIHLTNWAVALEAGGQPALAAPQIQRAVATFRQLDSEHGPGAAMLRTLGSILSVVGQHDDAIAAVDEAVAGARTAGSPIGSFWALGIASRVYGEADRLDRSEAMLRELQAIASSQQDLPVRERAGAERFLAQAAIRRGNGAAAVDLAQSAVKRLEAAIHTGREMLQIVSILATALNTAGRFEQARATAQRALEIARRRQDEYAHTYEIGLAALELGVAELGLKRHDAARQWLVMALANLRETATDNAPATMRASARLAALDKAAAGL
jgi:tetratricopeptide (TPR) repeat protein